MGDERLPARELGRHGEELALLHLETLGFTLVDRNVRMGSSEIDLVVRDRLGYAFVEVKTRSSVRHGEPWECLLPAQRARLVHAARRWLERERAFEADWRLGVVALVLDPTGAVTSLDWIDEA